MLNPKLHRPAVPCNCTHCAPVRPLTVSERNVDLHHARRDERIAELDYHVARDAGRITYTPR